jgi:multiple sugar transport system substrate-binding protein
MTYASAPPTGRGGSGRRRRRGLAVAASLALASGLLAACSGDSGKPELIWYTNPDTGGQADLAAECSTDDYTITTEVLPQDASQQRVQLVRRLAAGDTEIDLMSLDPPFTAEFAAAGYLLPLPDELQSTLEEQSFEGAVEAATWEDELVVAPFWSNTQVLWYRKSFVEKTDLDMDKPVTWDQVIDAASENGGKIGVQANKYEAYAIWVNALVAGAGGSILEDAESGVEAEVAIDSEAGDKAEAIIKKLAESKAAPSDLSVSNEGTAAATFGADDGAFQVNWTFIYNNYGEDPVSKDIGFAPYPQTVEGEESRPPFGGIGIGVGAETQYPEEAMAAVECITKPENQGIYAVSSGNMPASAEGYEHPELKEIYPPELLQLFQDSVDKAAPRVVSPYWSDISLAIQSSWHPASSVSDDTAQDSAKVIKDILEGGLL